MYLRYGSYSSCFCTALYVITDPWDVVGRSTKNCCLESIQKHQLFCFLLLDKVQAKLQT